MKKILLVMMVLLSAVANANKVYDHVSACRITLENMTTKLQYIATYTVTEAQEQKRYVGVFSRQSPDVTYLLERGRRVNNIRSYNYIFDGETYHLTFIAMDGALYMMVNGGKPFIISTEIEDKDNVIDIIKDGIGFTVVDNQTTETGQINTRLMSFYMVKRRGFILPFNSTIFTIKGEKAMSAGSSLVGASDESYSMGLLLATDKNLYRLERRSIDSWDRMSKDEIDNNDKIIILPSNGRDVFLVKYNNRTGKWSYLNDIIRYVEPKDFIPLAINQDSNYFDYAVISSLNRAVMGAFSVARGLSSHYINFFGVNYHGDRGNFGTYLINQRLVSANIFFSDSTAGRVERVADPEEAVTDPEALYLTMTGMRYRIYANMETLTGELDVECLYSLPM